MDKGLAAANRNTWDSSGIVRFYTRLRRLLEPEKRIYETLGPEFKNMRMLDIGVGAGRTTFYFAPEVKEYTGIDYCANMIDACKARFNVTPDASFFVCDARSIDIAADSSFDFILFSYNGIDYVSLEDRIRILKEVRRVAIKRARFAFSAHNQQHIPEWYRPRFQYKPKGILREIIRIFAIRVQYRNWQDAMKYDHVIINDGLHFFRFKTLYIKPSRQVSQLEENGFSNVRVFELGGEEVSGSLEAAKDEYLYYLCTVEK